MRDEVGWDLGRSSQTNQNGPLFDFVSLRSPIFRTRNSRDGQTPVVGISTGGPLRYAGASGAFGSRRFTVPIGDEGVDIAKRLGGREGGRGSSSEICHRSAAP